ncbi:MAG: hypothetical protein CL607_10955 [Anaerolineaceae bacterium]|nr:hypothetical protein [Anaerolineaceae bacterium]
MPKSFNSKSSGFSYDIREDGIIVYRLANLRRDTVDEFVEVSRNFDVVAYEAGRHSRCLLDISKLSFPTPYAIKRLRENTESTPDGLKESWAVLAPTSRLYTFMMTNLKGLTKSKVQPVRLFQTEEEAFAWLEQRLEELGP